MHRFDYRGLTGTLDARLANLASILYDLRARNELRGQQDAVGFERLKQAAVIESVRGSNAIESIVTTKDRLAELMQGAEPYTHGEQEIVGYRNALQEIYALGISASLSEDYLCHLHSLLLGSTSAEGEHTNAKTTGSKNVMPRVTSPYASNRCLRQRHQMQ